MQTGIISRKRIWERPGHPSPEAQRAGEIMGDVGIRSSVPVLCGEMGSTDNGEGRRKFYYTLLITGSNF